MNPREDANGKTQVADGVHSRLRNRILGDDSIHVKKMGLSCYRVAASADAVKEVLGGSLPHWWEPTTAQNRVCILNDGSDRFVAAYPLRHHQYMNFSCIFPSRMSKQSNRTNSWSADANSEEIIEIFHDFEESFRKILRYVYCVHLKQVSLCSHFFKHRDRSKILGTTGT